MAALARVVSSNTAVAVYSYPGLRGRSRCFSSELFVAGISARVDAEMLRTAFVEHGPVENVKIFTEHGTRFGFVAFSHESHAEVAKSKMNNFVLGGRSLRIEMASDDNGISLSDNLLSSSSPVFEAALNAESKSVTGTFSAQNSGKGCRSFEDASTSFLYSNLPVSIDSGSMETSYKDGGYSCKASNNLSQFDAIYQDVQPSETVLTTRSISTSDAVSVFPPDISDEYDFRTFPDLKSSAYENYSMPSAMLQRSKRHALLKGVNLETNILESKPCIKSIPPFKGNPYDFGLNDLLGALPLLETAAKPLGGFDVNISVENLKDGGENSSAQPQLQPGMFSESSFGQSTKAIDFDCSSSSSIEAGPGEGRVSAVISETSEPIGDRLSSMNITSRVSLLASAEPDDIVMVASRSRLLDGEHDFRTLPDLKSNAYVNYVLPTALLHRRKHCVFVKNRALASSESDLNVKSIPPFRGTPYDFGLKDVLKLTSPFNVGAKLGRFDVNIPFDFVIEQETS